MTNLKKSIRVLVVDDSPLARELIRSILEEDPAIRVIGEAGNGIQAMAQVAALKPDIVTMDINMPLLGGLETIERIMAERPVPILVVTGMTSVRMAFAAISKGALDVVEKPDVSLENAGRLRRKVVSVANYNLTARRPSSPPFSSDPRRSAPPVPRAGAPSGGTIPGKVVVIAASTGGPQALQAILAQLPETFPCPIVIAQHIANGFAQGMAEWLNGGAALKVGVVGSDQRLVPGRVYLNPPEHAMRIGQGGMIRLGERPEGFYQPCCDTLLTSIAAAYRQKAMGVILSGMGDDGVSGMQALQQAGGFTLAQDEESSVIYGMNRLAVERGYIHKVVPLNQIAAELQAWAGAD